MDHKIGTVFKRMKNFYYIDVAGTEFLCRAKGGLFKGKNKGNTIAVGDEVEFDPDASSDAGWIHRVLPRKSKLARPSKEGRHEQIVASNVEHLLIVTAIKKPPFRSGMVDRFLITAQRGNLQPILVLNKIDLASDDEIQDTLADYVALGCQILKTSVKQQIGLDELKALLTNHTSVLSGHSGVGKSSLLKALYPGWNIRIGQVNEISEKGKHTTTISEMYRLPDGGYVIDTPGIRELGLYQLPPEDLSQYFVEFAEAEEHCYFKGCTHRHEPRCGVKEAVEAEDISQTRYDNYCSIYESLLET